MNSDSAGQHRVAFTLVFALAITMRLFVIFHFTAEPTSDAADYHRLAISIVKTHSYVAYDGSPTAWRPPAYPFFLAGIYSVFGVSVFKACLVQAILGGLTVLLLMYLAMRIVDQKTAMVSGFIAAIYPGLIYPSRLLLTENLAIPLLLLSLSVAIIVARSDHLWTTALLGVSLGLSVLTRSANTAIATLLLGAVMINKWRFIGAVKAIKSVSLASLTLALTLAPWGIRNYLVFHRLTPLTTQEGIMLYASYWPPKHGSKYIWGNMPLEDDPVIVASSKAGDEVAVSEYFKRESINRLKARPLYFFQLWPSKLIYLMAPFDWETFPHPTGSSRSFNWVYVFILLLAALGTLAIIRRPINHKWALLPLPAAVLILTLIFQGTPRYRLIAEPILIIVAAIGAVEIVKGSKSILFKKLVFDTSRPNRK